MAIAQHIQDHLVWAGVNFGAVRHPHGLNGTETARRVQVSGECAAKSIVWDDDDRFIVGVASFTRHVWPGKLSEEMKRKLRLATEAELPSLFAHCERATITALGPAYGISTVIHDSVAEAGDHESLIRMSAVKSSWFASVRKAARTARITCEAGGANEKRGASPEIEALPDRAYHIAASIGP